MLKITLLSSIPAMAVAGLMMYAAWQHNTQGEIHIDGVIDWDYWLLLGLSWFLPVFIITFLFSVLFRNIGRR